MTINLIVSLQFNLSVSVFFLNSIRVVFIKLISYSLLDLFLGNVFNSRQFKGHVLCCNCSLNRYPDHFDWIKLWMSFCKENNRDLEGFSCKPVRYLMNFILMRLVYTAREVQ